ncbi:MAG: hypothetical protein Q9223_001124 [Gallowayella weberi]
MPLQGRSALNAKAAQLLQELVGKYDEKYGLGSMSCTIYDTAWLAMITKFVHGKRQWLFPTCFQYVLDNQLASGGWPSYASEIDGILNTMAALLAINLHCKEPCTEPRTRQEDLMSRSRKATDFLQTALNNWDVAGTLHVGFEILVPSLLNLLDKAGTEFNFPGRRLLCTMRDSKMTRFHPSIMYSETQTTLLHSLEALVGLIDFDRISHHKINGSMMASPSSTAAYLIYATVWDNDSEDYLRHVLSASEGDGKGGVPSAFPSTHFEIIWDLNRQNVERFGVILQDAFDTGRGLVGFGEMCQVQKGRPTETDINGITLAHNIDPDVDDTSKGIQLLNKIGIATSATAMVKYFEASDHFRTYCAERNASFSANCNALGALLSADTPMQHSLQIEKVVRFLCDSLWDDIARVDKWVNRSSPE